VPKKTRRAPKRYPTVALHPGTPADHDPRQQTAGEPTYGRWRRLRWLLNATREMFNLYCKLLFGRWK
jgi:hypothetical protein